MTEDRVNPQTDTGIDWLRPLRYLWRVPWLLVHLFVNLPLTLLAVRFGHAERDGEETLRERAIRWWSGSLCRIFGIRVEAHGSRPADPVLVVANHVSWLDIEVLHTLWPLSFVAKAEIEHWPVIGPVASAGGTVYHRRGCDDSRDRVTGAMTDRLRSGGSVAIFPEGRTGHGDRVLPFHGRLLAAAVDAGCPILPVAIRFLRDGERVHNLAFGLEEHFLGNFLRVLGEPACVAEVHYLKPIDPDSGGRRDLARGAQAQVAVLVDS